MAVIHLNQEEFVTRVADPVKYPAQWEFRGAKPAVVDFYATWCGPCQALGPVLDQVSEHYATKVDIYKVNVDENPDLAEAFGVRSIPTLLFAAAGATPQIWVGSMSKGQLEAKIDELLK